MPHISGDLLRAVPELPQIRGSRNSLRSHRNKYNYAAQDLKLRQ